MRFITRRHLGILLGMVTAVALTAGALISFSAQTGPDVVTPVALVPVE